ncbi:MAG TPA: (Fe-S)-binding protein [Polyangiaceae bacterium]|jgi:L-lactate dehydrogenase complex protein LldE
MLAPFALPAPRVKLMATCLCDVFYDDVAAATVEILEHLGCTVDVPLDQTCCGQPAFNAGDWPAARPVARHTLRVFDGKDPVIVPSGSCARMVSHGAMLLFEKEGDRPAAEKLAERTWELADFIVHGLGVSDWPGRLEGRFAFHRSCHSRGTRYAEAALTLLRSIAGLAVEEFDEAEQCCGFGGTFSVAFPNISRGIGTLKLEHAPATASDGIVSADMGCLMHLEGLAKKAGRDVKTRHVAQVLRDALRGEAPGPRP